MTRSFDDGHLPEEVLLILVENHQQFLSFLKRRAESDSDAEEILQAAMLKSVEKGSGIREGQSTVAWFYQLLRNALVDRRRTRAAEARALELEAREPATTEDPNVDAMVCVCMNELVDSLKPEYVSVLKRVELEGTTIGEYARETGITVNNVRVRVHRAREALRRQMLETCGACTREACLNCLCRAAAERARSTSERDRP